MATQTVEIKMISRQSWEVINSDQIRMARLGMRWTIKELARRSGLGVATVSRAEAGHVSQGNMYVLQHTFEDAGLSFLDDGQESASGGAGVRLPPKNSQ